MLFCFVSIALIAVAQFIDSGDFSFIEGDAPNQRPLLDDICVEIVPPGFPGIAEVVVSTTDASAIRMCRNSVATVYSELFAISPMLYVHKRCLYISTPVSSL